ncbi:MAG: maleylpyruvate isomerase N-terminal domain-containing protein [Trebonia sp.]
MITGDDVLAAAAACREFLEDSVGADWSAPVPGLDFTVRSVTSHAVNCVLWYAVDLWGGTGGDSAFDLKMLEDAANADILVSMRSAARVCAASVNAAPADVRGFHPAGSADASGFAAMACDELLVHTHDAALGLGRRFSPDPELAGRVLARLFPWHEQGDDPWPTLLWANDRVGLPGRPDQAGWMWRCAPPADWDGRTPELARNRGR